jgi:nicotinamidase/pyrazinamidase
MKIASFDVDAEKCFTPLCPDELPVPGGDEIVGELNAQAELADLRVGSKDCHPPKALWTADENHPQFSPIEDGGPNVDIYWKSHGVVGTYGNELLDGLPKVEDYDFFVFKGIESNLHPYGACYHDMEEKMSTGVIEWLKSKGVKIVIVGGLAYDYCVKITAIQLAKAGFIVIINIEATRAIDLGTSLKADGEFAEMNLHEDKIIVVYGGVKSVKQYLDARVHYDY